MGFDITKVLVSSAAVAGIGLLMIRLNEAAADAVWYIVEKTYNEINDSYVEPEKYLRERVENVSSLIKQVLEDEQKMLKAVKDGQDVKELELNIIRQIEIIFCKVDKLEEDCPFGVDEDLGEKIEEFKYFYCVTQKMIKYWEDGEEPLTRLCERKHFKDEGITLFLKG